MQGWADTYGIMSIQGIVLGSLISVRFVLIREDLFTLIAIFIRHFSLSLLHWSIFIIYLFYYTINRFVFCETEKIDNLSVVGD